MTSSVASAAARSARGEAARVPALAATLAFAVGVVVLLGWTLHLDVLRGVAGVTGVMNPMTAAAIALCAGALACLGTTPRRPRLARFGLALAALAGAIAALRLAGAIPGFPFDVDRLLFPATLRISPATDGRMAWTTAAAITALAGALLLIDGRAKGQVIVRESLLGAVLALGLEAVVRHTYAFIPSPEALHAGTMALHTAIALVALGFATLLARPDQGVARLLTGHEPGSVLLRRTLPALAALNVVLGWMRLNVERAGTLSAEASIALMVFVSLLLIGTVLFVHAVAMNRADAASRGAMQRLGESEDRFRHLFEAAPVGILIVDTHGRCRYANSRWQEITGFTPATAEGHGWMRAIHPEDRKHIGELWKQASSSGEEFSSELRFRRPDGGERVVIARAIAMRDSEGGLSGYVNTNEDVTDWKKIQQELADARGRELEMKDQLLSNVSHELRSPLTAIYEFTALLKDGLAGPINDQQLEFLGIVLRNTEQLRGLIDDLLEVSRARTGKLSVSCAPFDLSVLAREVVEAMQPRAAKRGLSLRVDAPADLPVAFGDARRMRQVIGNLLDNAFKFTPEGGDVHVRAWTDRTAGIAGVSVSDSGPGIPPDERERVFEYLYQTNHDREASRKGLGIGLFLCRELMSRQKGRIWVESPPERGATFSVALPEFSIAALIAPVIEKPRSPDDLPAALLHVRLRGGASRPLTRGDREALEVARDLLERCSRPGRDVLLPDLGHDGFGSFWLFARANAPEARVLAERIEKLLAGSKTLIECGLSSSVSVQSLDPPAWNRGLEPDTIATEWAGQVLAQLEARANRDEERNAA